MRYSDQDIIDAVSISRSFNEVQKNLNAGTSGSMYMHIKKRVLDIGCDITHFNPNWNSVNSGGHNKKAMSEVLILRKDKQREKSARLRRCMIEYGIEYICAGCGNDSWNGKALTLECEHINGINYDNRPENLCFLCPNCHSQTETYGFRGKPI